jgi:hypothetical protein
VSGLGAAGLPGVVPMAHPLVGTREGFEARLGLCLGVVRCCLALKTLTGPAFLAQLDAFMKSFVWASKNNPDFFSILGRSLPGIALGGMPGLAICCAFSNLLSAVVPGCYRVTVEILPLPATPRRASRGWNYRRGHRSTVHQWGLGCVSCP